MYLVEIFGTQAKTMQQQQSFQKTTANYDTAEAKYAVILAARPVETELFFNVDREFRSLMVQVRRHPAVVSACSKSGLFHTLKIMRKVC